jgi:asparagine synthase (glutamine-hydrolysing)
VCGIVGVVGGAPLPPETFAAMRDALHRRGPDGEGAWTDAEARVSLGHRRLAVVELSDAGAQPMVSHDGRFVLTFNGEIYNHREMRQRFESAHGARSWRGHSDTETLLEWIAARGVAAAVEHAIGMFAFAVWDRRDRRLTLARDRFGEKPMYYGWSGDAFLFASELQPFRRYPGFDRAVDRDVAALYLQWAHVPAPYAIHPRTYKLQPGCLLVLDAARSAGAPSSAPFAPFTAPGLAIERYWSLADRVTAGARDLVRDPQEAVDGLDRLLADAVRLQSDADVPLGAFLSGGIDSSTIVALMQAQASRPVRTFSIGFSEEGFNEAEDAKRVAAHLGTSHTEMYVTPSMARDVIPLLPSLYAEPFADASQIPTYLVSRMTREHVTVALSGDAGDELFGGYNRYFWGERVWKRVAWMPAGIRHLAGRTIEAVPAAGWDALGRAVPGMRGVARLGDKAHKLARRMRTVDSMDGLYRSLVTEWSPTDGAVAGSQRLRTLFDDPGFGAVVPAGAARMMFFDTMTYLPDTILQKVDRAAMAVSLETRVPFLDHRVVEYAWRVPMAMKIREGQGKWLLRQVLDRYVPRALVDRPKAGFGVPIAAWLRGPLRPWAEELLGPAALHRVGLLAEGPVRSRWHEHLSGTRDWATQLWPALMLQAWATSLAD